MTTLKLIIALGLYLIAIFGVYAETGIWTTITLTTLTFYTVVSTTGNSIYSHKLHHITTDLSNAVQLISKQLK